MIRTILKPESNQFTIELPDDMVGKTIEIIVFALDEVREIQTKEQE